MLSAAHPDHGKRGGDRNLKSLSSQSMCDQSHPHLHRIDVITIALGILTGHLIASGVERLLDAVLSVEEVGVYKHHPQVYQLAVDRLAVTLPLRRSKQARVSESLLN
jgi:hypothetical protein